MWQLVAELERRGKPADDHITRHGSDLDPNQLDNHVDGEHADRLVHRADHRDPDRRSQGLHGR
ncbi:MAG: hypothetical protein ACXVFQ_16410 [Solirubrobacteraceae bacterium]